LEKSLFRKKNISDFSVLRIFAMKHKILLLHKGYFEFSLHLCSQFFFTKKKRFRQSKNLKQPVWTKNVFRIWLFTEDQGIPSNMKHYVDPSCLLDGNRKIWYFLSDGNRKKMTPYKPCNTGSDKSKTFFVGDFLCFLLDGIARKFFCFLEYQVVIITNQWLPVIKWK